MDKAVDDIFLVPVTDKYLLYSPLQHFAALVNRQAAQRIRASLQSGAIPSGDLKPITEHLLLVEAHAPAILTGPLQNPAFLGMIPTRNCNLGCRYCDFAAPKQGGPVMEFDVARQAIDAYLMLLRNRGQSHADVHFFGGEPFCALEAVHFIVDFASIRASELGLRVRFEAITNGLFSSKTCRWIAGSFDTIILSLDGPADIHEFQRPSRNNHSTFPTIIRNAGMLSESAVELILRVCVTHQTVGRLAEIAAWVAQNFRPSSVCFETLTESRLSRAEGLLPPSPREFARNFVEATRVLNTYGIESVTSTANIEKVQASFCPVGKDALLVSPEGRVSACYLLPEDWSRRDLELHFGRITRDGFEIDKHALQRIRNLSVYSRPLCSDCLSRYHCGGGCHVNHDTARARGYDDLCIQTRLLTIAKLLVQIKQDRLVDEWLRDRSAMEVSVMQPTDRLSAVEFTQ